MTDTEREAAQRVIGALAVALDEHFEVLKAHHPDGPHVCAICSLEAPGMGSRLDQAVAAVGEWRDAYRKAG